MLCAELPATLICDMTCMYPPPHNFVTLAPWRAPERVYCFAPNNIKHFFHIKYTVSCFYQIRKVQIICENVLPTHAFRYPHIHTNVLARAHKK